MKILSFWSGHDASFCVLNDGAIEMHTELERHIREKEPAGDSIAMFYEHHGDTTDTVGIATAHLANGIQARADSWKRIESLDKPLYVCGHHVAHAANAFFSSNLDDAVIVTVDGGGVENDKGFIASITAWVGQGNKIAKHLFYVPADVLNIGGIWTRATRYIFRYESGWPQGHQAGTVMALAALGDPEPYIKDFRSFFHENFHVVNRSPDGHVRGMSAKDPKSPKHPFLGKWEEIANADEREKYNMAASLQLATEEVLRQYIGKALAAAPHVKNLCLAGGVVLNSVMTGKLRTWFPQLREIYIPPVPADAGLTIGAAQYAWHHVLDKPRIKWIDNVKPYMGKKYSKDIVDATLKSVADKINVTDGTDEDVVQLLDKGNIVSVFNGSAESGRRALGNRTIMADPRKHYMKERINKQVKMRQWFRPYAPTILREEVINWFKTDVDSPFMGFVAEFKDDKKFLVPAVVHFDGTARLQTVTENDNKWYYGFIKKWEKKTGIPIVLNTSFNDREPICETPEHALKCFIKTEIDYMYFPEFGYLIKKKK
jgi:carbamoyltransferase